MIFLILDPRMANEAVRQTSIGEHSESPQEQSSLLVLYSVNAVLAYRIAQKYYKRIHYAWCSPYFDLRSVGPVEGGNPPTSLPSAIYRALLSEAKGGDLHSANIARIRAGLLRGADFKLAAQVIDQAKHKEIVEIIQGASAQDFKPLVYVIPVSSLVESRLEHVPVRERANPLSSEYRLPELPRGLFSVQDLEDVIP